MSRRSAPSEFRGKTWIYVASFLVVGGLAAFSLVMGPLFLTGAMKDARGQPATDAGIALCIFGVLLTLVAALPLFRIMALRKPLLRLCREGIVVNRIAASSLDDLPQIPGLGKGLKLLHAAWLIVSLQGFRQHLVYAPWHTFQAAQVSGFKMARELTIVALFHRMADGCWQPNPIGDQLTFQDAEFASTLDKIAESALYYAANMAAREQLPSWHG